MKTNFELVDSDNPRPRLERKKVNLTRHLPAFLGRGDPPTHTPLVLLQSSWRKIPKPSRETIAKIGAKL